MPGNSDSGQPDDIKLHLQGLVAADDGRKIAAAGESEDAKATRESVIFRPKLRTRIDKVLVDLGQQLPGLSAAEVAKLTATRAGRDALGAGVSALGRVDDHLQGVTEERNPLAGKRYGVFGENPTSFGGVLRSLAMCVAEDDAVAKLSEEDEGRDLAFSPVVRKAVVAAAAGMQALVGEKAATRGDLARGHTVKDTTLAEATACISAARQHLYANLPNRKVDDDLYDYGFRPIHFGGGRPAKGSGEKGGDGAPVGPNGGGGVAPG